MTQHQPGEHQQGECAKSSSEKIGENQQESAARLEQAPDATVVRNATGDALAQARDANPDRHSGSAGGNPDDGSFTLVAITEGKTTVIAERAPGSGQVRQQTENISEQNLRSLATSGDQTADLLLKELREIRNQKLPNESEAREIKKLLAKATKIYPTISASSGTAEADLTAASNSSAQKEPRTSSIPSEQQEMIAVSITSAHQELNAEPPTVRDFRRGATASSDRAPHLTPSQIALEKRFGVKVVMNGDQAEYHMQAYGRDNLLFSSKSDDIAGAEKRLHEMVKAQESRLTAMYGVTFSTDTDTAGFVLDANLQPTSEIAHCRAPRLDELIGIEAGLSHSAPSQYSASGKALEFVFIRAGQHHISGRPIGANYEYGEPPKVFMDPTTDTNVPTELDKVGNWGRSTEYQVVHELTHGAQERIGFKTKSTPTHESIEEMFAHEAGWVRGKDKQFYLKGKNGDLYKCDLFDSTKWTRYRLDKNDNAIKLGAATSAQVRADALITPPTDYMQNPKEEMSECLTAYRLGGHYRDAIKPFQNLYDMIRRIDQADINKGYPPDSKGNFQYLRAENGSLVKNPSFIDEPKGKQNAKPH
ncbi:hypothetical protein KF728_21105 [Candidatus Obscuribacterales bacterium]|nr:hypothetical protein [Candidatus Obscuribacterales bacterium]MBX3152669.1 hypothetical protein [Candidatus Obscuribacterales bacterium]